MVDSLYRQIGLLFFDIPLFYIIIIIVIIIIIIIIINLPLILDHQ